MNCRRRQRPWPSGRATAAATSKRISDCDCDCDNGNLDEKQPVNVAAWEQPVEQGGDEFACMRLGCPGGSDRRLLEARLSGRLSRVADLHLSRGLSDTDSDSRACSLANLRSQTSQVIGTEIFKCFQGS